MNTVKKIIALITVILVIIRLFVINVSASFAAPFIAEETLKTVLIEGILAGGSDYTKDDLEAWELEDLENEFEIQMTTNPNFKPKKAVPVFFDINNPGLGYNEDSAAFDKMANQVVSDWLSGSLGENIYDKIYPTYNIPIDMQGMGGAYRIPYDYGNGQGRVDSYRVYLFDYAEISEKSDGVYYTLVNAHEYVYRLDGTLWYENPYVSNRTFSGLKSGEERYGDWRYADGTKLDTDDEAIPVIGEADGTQVTPDMLNPDGTVTIDGTTYYPKDFIDWEKFKDNAIIDLLNEILKAIENAPVSETDTTKDLVDSITGSISVPEELSDYMMPVGISSVFPFCLPFDLYRGVKLLSSPAIAPVLKIPFNIPEFGLFKGYKTELVIDFAKYDKYFSVFRWGIYFIFALSLIFISTKIVKGAGA